MVHASPPARPVAIHIPPPTSLAPPSALPVAIFVPPPAAPVPPLALPVAVQVLPTVALVAEQIAGIFSVQFVPISRKISFFYFGYPIS